MRINPDDYKPHEIWQMVMIGKPIKRYPNGYFSGASCNEKFREIFQYICLQHYQWELEEVPQHINSYFLKDNKLASLYNSLFHCNMFEMLDTAFPGRFHPWKLPVVPNGYWNLETAKEATIWLIEKKLHWTKDDIKKKMTKETFINNGVGCLYMPEFNGSIYKALCNAYGDDYLMPWELKCTPMSYWNDDTIKLPLQWLIEKKGYTKQSIMNLTEKEILEYGFYVAYTLCHESLIQLLDATFPGEYEKVGNDIYHLPSHTRSHRNNRDNIAGVIYSKHLKRWMVYATQKGKTKYIGLYNNEKEATNARIEFEKQTIKERKDAN